MYIFYADFLHILQVGPNPYTWFTMETLKETWENLERLIKEREEELTVEHRRQEESDRLRRKGPVTHDVRSVGEGGAGQILAWIWH